MAGRMRGFTLLELLVVLVLVALAMAAVAPRFSGTVDSATFKKNARQLVSALRELRTDSVAEGYETALQVDEDSLGYQMLPEGKEVLLPTGVGLDLSPGSPASTGLAMEPRTIAFYPDGSSSGGELRITAATGMLTVSVDWLTGEVSISETP